MKSHNSIGLHLLEMYRSVFYTLSRVMYKIKLYVHVWKRILVYALFLVPLTTETNTHLRACGR